jgi:outer membrane protein assembly factor BamB
MKTKRSKATIVKELVPVPGGKVNGVTFDGTLVWFARDEELVGLDPESGAIVRRIAIPADAGTAYDGESLYQIAGSEIFVVRPSDGKVLRTIKAPGAELNSGMAYADGHLFIGQWKDATIIKIDAKTGAIVGTFRSDRFVTGVSCVDGAIWHGAETEGARAELRKLGPTGEVEEVIEMPDGARIAGVESDGEGAFWCGGEKGTLRLVRATPG